MGITMKLSEDEIRALSKILVPIHPTNYDIHTFSILRNLYGRVERALLKLDSKPIK